MTIAMKDLWAEGNRRGAGELGKALLTDLALGDGATSRLELELMNNVGFVELASGHLPQALELLERCAVSGGLAESRDAMWRVILLCNLAAATAGVGRYVEAERWSEQATGLVNAVNGPAGWLVVYSPDPDWSKAPELIDHPDPGRVAAGTRAGAMAARGDQAALEVARDLSDELDEPWADRLLHAIERALGQGSESTGRAREEPSNGD